MTNPNSPTSPTQDDAPSKTTTTLPPLTTHTHTIIFLHGREDYGSDLATSLFDSTSSLHPTHTLRTLFPTIKWVFPTAAMRYCAKRDEEFRNSSFAEGLKGEEIVGQWFDVWDLGNPEESRELMGEGLGESVRQIQKIVCEEVSLVGKEQVVLGGISQGCATALYTLLSLDAGIGGFIGVSSWLPFRGEIERILGECGGERGVEIGRFVRGVLGLEVCGGFERRIPVFLSHSKDDETVPFSYGEGLRDNLQKILTNSPITWRDYEDGGHWIHPQHGVDDISTFLNRSIGIPSPILGEGSQETTCVATLTELPNQEPRKNTYEETCARLEEMTMEIKSWEEQEQARISMGRRNLEIVSPLPKPHVSIPCQEPRKVGYEEMCERLAKQELEKIERRKGGKGMW